MQATIIRLIRNGQKASAALEYYCTGEWRLFLLPHRVLVLKTSILPKQCHNIRFRIQRRINIRESSAVVRNHSCVIVNHRSQVALPCVLVDQWHRLDDIPHLINLAG